jgi:hypothetical protein
MRFRYHWALLAVALAVVVAPGQEKDAKTPPGPRPDAAPEKNEAAPTVEIRFADDSSVKMTLEDNNIEVATRYGKLTVPVADIRRMELGLRIPPATARRIDAAIALLGSPEFKEREAATAELLALRELAYPALQQATRSTDAEVARRAKDAVKSLAETVPAEKLNLPRHDTVVTRAFTIVGQVETPSLKVRSPYFGATSVKLADVRGLRCPGNEQEAKVVVDAARYGGQQETWLDTGIEAHAGGALQITATGSVDLQPIPGGGATYVVGPDGAGGVRMGRGGGFPAGGGRGVARAGGVLMGRIGENGKAFVVGSHFEGTASEDGKLYLRITPSPYNSDSSGTYEVRVTTTR